MEITCLDGEVTIRENLGDGTETVTTKHVDHPGDTLREVLARYKSPVMEKMPTFTGGLVGYFSYDYIKYSEPKLKLTSEGQQDFRDMDLMLFNEVIAFDHYRQKIHADHGSHDRGHRRFLSKSGRDFRRHGDS